MEKLSPNKVSQEEIKDTFDKFVMLFKRGSGDIAELRWFFDTASIKEQSQILLIAINLLVGISRKECLVKDGRLSLPCTISHDLVMIMNEAVKRSYQFNSDTPLSDLMEVMIRDPSDELSSEEIDRYYSEGLKSC